MHHSLFVLALILLGTPGSAAQGKASSPAAKTPATLQDLILKNTAEAVRTARKKPDQAPLAVQTLMERVDLQITERQLVEARSTLDAVDRFVREFNKSTKSNRMPTEAIQGRRARIAGIELIDGKQYAEAEKKLREALDLSRKNKDPVLEAGVHNNLGLAIRYGASGAKEKLEEAVKEFEAARSMAEGQQDPLRAGSYNFNLGQILLDLGRPDQALEAFRRSAEQSKTAAKPNIEARAVLYQGVSLSRLNSISDEPVKFFENAYRMFVSQEDERNAGWSLFLMAEHYAYGSKPKQAAAAAERAVPLLLKTNDKPGLTRCYTLLGEMYLRLDDKPKSESFRKKLADLSSAH